jgi:hypothetical protein
MTEDDFWTIIDASRERAKAVKLRPQEDFIDVHEKTLAEALRALAPERVVAFNDRFWFYHHLAYRWDLWAAAYWLHGGCSDDGFIDFRACLISLGRTLFFKVLSDPDELADIVDRPAIPYMQAEGFQYVAGKVYEELTGEEQIPLTDSDDSGPWEPTGVRIDHDDDEVMRRHFPRIVARFPDMGE